MMQEYCFFKDGVVQFDDSKSVKELIAYAFDVFDYYEPLGMDIVTIFQSYSPKTSTGWFTTDTSKSCAEEITSPDSLCFAYYMPDVFFFSEGGWGKHMKNLGNHPILSDPISLHLQFDDFRNVVVINGKYCFRDIISFLKKSEYISEGCNCLKVFAVYGDGISRVNNSYRIPFSDDIMDVCLKDFEIVLDEYTKKHLAEHDRITYMILELKEE